MRCFHYSLVILAVFGQAGSVEAQETSADQEAQKAHAAAAIRLAKEETPKWEFFVGDDEKTKAILRPEPLQRWWNPLGGTEHGAGAIPDGIVYGDVYIWTHQGRPEVVMSIHTYMEPRRHTTKECHSLALDRLTGVRNGRRAWYPNRPGIQLEPIPDATPPADSAVRRLSQMRAMAREFSAESTDLNGNSWQLRLLPKPIYRYENTEGDLLDGAMFAFVRGTDPDLWMLIEARAVEGGHQWQYGLATFNGKVESRVDYKDTEVWTTPRLVPPWENAQNPSKPYFLLMTWW